MNIRMLAAAATASMMMLAGCGSDSSLASPPPPASPSATFNDTMETFIKMNVGDLPPQAPPAPPPPDCNVLRCIALTFDDGPGGGTGQVLDNLRDRGAKATFFVLGELAEANPDIIRRMVAEGHQLANHSWDHDNLRSLGAAGAAEDVHRTNGVLHDISGVWPTVMRPPYGSTNDAIVASVNMPQMIWSVDPQDWKFRDSNYVANHVINNATRGDIILLHDIHGSTVSAVPAILDGLLSQGYTFVTIDQLYNYQPLEVRLHYSQYR